MNATTRHARRSVATGVTMLLAAALGSLPVFAQASAEPEIRTSVPELGGYTAAALSSPISLQLFEPVIPVPAGPGEPHGELHGSYSRATLGTGPASRGLGSAIWPGATAGDGLSAFDPRIPPYPFKASATYPDGPFEDLGNNPEPFGNRGDTNTHTGMFAYARGIDVYGESNGGGELVPGFMTAGNISTVSTVTIEAGVVIAETVATISDLDIAGMITIDGLQTRLVSRTNGAVAETSGTYEVSGLEIMGQGYEMDEDGITATGPAGDPITIPLGLGNSIDLSDAIGITVETTPIVEDVDGPTGARSTRGLVITIDTTPLRQAARDVPLATVIDLIPDVPELSVIPCDQVPSEMGFLPCFSNPLVALKANLYTLAALSPKVQVLLGGGQVASSASLPFDFSPPPLPSLPPAPSITGGAPVYSAPVFGQSPTFSPPAAVAPAPQVASDQQPTSPGTQVVALTIPDGISGGIEPGLVLLGLGGVALAARGGRRLTMAAMYSTGGHGGAASVPDLRAFADRKGR